MSSTGFHEAKVLFCVAIDTAKLKTIINRFLNYMLIIIQWQGYSRESKYHQQQNILYPKGGRFYENNFLKFLIDSQPIIERRSLICGVVNIA